MIVSTFDESNSVRFFYKDILKRRKKIHVFFLMKRQKLLKHIHVCCRSSLLVASAVQISLLLRCPDKTKDFFEPLMLNLVLSSPNTPVPLTSSLFPTLSLVCTGYFYKNKINFLQEFPSFSGCKIIWCI